MASPGNQHCANCIGTLSFSIGNICSQINPFTHFDRTPTCDRETDRQTDTDTGP